MSWNASKANHQIMVNNSYGSFVMITHGPTDLTNYSNGTVYSGSTQMWGPSRYLKNEAPIFL